MNHLYRFFRLPGVDRLLVIRALFLLGAIRLGLWFVSFQALRRTLGRRAAVRSVRSGQFSSERIAWAVRVASRYVPRATCLVQALAAQRLLETGGYPAKLHIGVAKNPEGSFLAHAWVEIEGKVVLGKHESGDYISVLSLDAAGI